jgi:hypothetical protein
MYLTCSFLLFLDMRFFLLFLEMRCTRKIQDYLGSKQLAPFAITTGLMDLDVAATNRSAIVGVVANSFFVIVGGRSLVGQIPNFDAECISTAGFTRIAWSEHEAITSNTIDASDSLVLGTIRAGNDKPVLGRALKDKTNCLKLNSNSVSPLGMDCPFLYFETKPKFAFPDARASSA